MNTPKFWVKISGYTWIWDKISDYLQALSQMCHLAPFLSLYIHEFMINFQYITIVILPFINLRTILVTPRLKIHCKERMKIWKNAILPSTLCLLEDTYEDTSKKCLLRNNPSFSRYLYAFKAADYTLFHSYCQAMNSLSWCNLGCTCSSSNFLQGLFKSTQMSLFLFKFRKAI